MVSPPPPGHRGFADWGVGQYLGFVVAATVGILFLVIPVHESIHYLVARSFGVQPVMHLGLGWGYVLASPPTRLATLCIGASPMVNEAFWGSLLMRRALARAGAVSLGLGMAFSFNFLSALMNVGESDFWNLSALGFGPLVLEVAGLAMAAGLGVAEAALRLSRPQAAV